ncbi:hypothetical protein [uncultured Algoriphagus sp.]|uniref:hypothetical protein n=1 Tax=uncultured Algoriphagus sp. TaxID=417365 RepID=UPI0030ED21D3|tara:strand:+ start:1173 stop:1499 length:327 start_codon:yes stop_codon:yes gene_type:complete
MITVSVLLTFLGFEFFYQTSKKAILSRPPKLESWFLTNEKQAKIIGSGLLLVGLVLSVIYLGVGSGIFAFLSMLMLMGSLVVLISPIWKLKIYWLFAGFVLLFLIEIL